MRVEVLRVVSPAAALPVIAGALLASCRGEAEPARNVAAAPAPQAPPSPADRARDLVRGRFGPQVRFGDAQVFTSEGATIVCGRFGSEGGAEQRYIAVAGEDLFVESEMEPGHMDQAFGEYCRNA